MNTAMTSHNTTHQTRTPRQRDGDDAEALAAAYLRRAGLQILTQNYRVRGGELDLIVLDGEALVFVEVRYRKSQRFGGAAASIDSRKQQRLIHAAQVYLMKHPRQADRPCRFDCILLDALSTEHIDWIKDAFPLI